MKISIEVSANYLVGGSLKDILTYITEDLRDFDEKYPHNINLDDVKISVTLA